MCIGFLHSIAIQCLVALCLTSGVFRIYMDLVYLTLGIEVSAKSNLLTLKLWLSDSEDGIVGSRRSRTAFVAPARRRGILKDPVAANLT